MMYTYIYMYIHVSLRTINIFTCVIANKPSLAAKKMGAWSWLPKFTSHSASISKCTMYELPPFMAVYRGEMFTLSAIWTSAPWLMRYSTTSVFPCSMATCSGVWLTYCVVWLMKAPSSNNSSHILTWPALAAHVRGVSPFRLWSSRLVHVWMWFFNLIFLVFSVCSCQKKTITW